MRRPSATCSEVKTLGIASSIVQLSRLPEANRRRRETRLRRSFRQVRLGLQLLGRSKSHVRAQEERARRAQQHTLTRPIRRNRVQLVREILYVQPQGDGRAHVVGGN